MLAWMVYREPDEDSTMTTRQRLWWAGILTTIALAVLMVTCSCVARPRPHFLPDLYRPAVTRLVMHEGGRKVGTCSAWKLADDLVATAGHCCESKYEYGLDHPEPDDLDEPAVLVDDDVHDVCVLRARMRGDAIQIAGGDPDVGAAVWTAGYPRGGFLISSGYWSGRAEDREGHCSVVVAGGASGSPILDAEGRAVGVLVKYVPGMDNFTIVAGREWLELAHRIASSDLGEPVRIVRPDEESAVEADLNDDLDRLLQDLLKTLPQL